jgi:hypothetical protein
MGVWPWKPGCHDNLIDIEDKGVADRAVGGLGGTVVVSNHIHNL